MAITLNGMQFSYDYSKILAEIKEDIAEGILSMSDSINVVRGDKMSLTGANSYTPIVDYYYTDFAETFLLPLQEDFPTMAEWKKAVAEREKVLDQYEKDKKNFELLPVSVVISEMEKMSKIL